MLIAVRHGATALNEDGKEKLRGWLPVPLNLDGMEQANDTAEQLSQIDDVKHIYTSDLVRAIQTAHEIGEALWLPIEPVEELRDWNTGDLAGKSVMSNLPIIHDHIDHPLKKLPGGESFQSYMDRTIPFLKKLIEDDDFHIAVTHNRTMTLLRALSANGGKHPKTSILKRKAPVEPSGFMIIDKDWNIAYAHKPDDLGNDEVDGDKD